VKDGLHIGMVCYPTFGGSGVLATELAMSLARRGHRLHLVSYETPARLDRFVENLFFHEVDIRNYPLFPHGHYALALASKLAELGRHEPLDLFHVHYAIPHAASAYLARQILGAGAPRLVTTLHGTDISLVGSDPSFLPITRFSILQSQGVTVPSAASREETYARLDIPREFPVEVIRNFVDTDVFRPLDQVDPASLQALFPHLGGAWSDARRRPRVLVHVSNFRPVKRVVDTIAVLRLLRQRLPAVLVLIGDGPERSHVEQEAAREGVADAVCFLGKQLEFTRVLQHAELFLQPSESESFGLAALEALACGVPVVGTRVGGVPEVVQEGVTGTLCAVGDVAGMARAAEALLTDGALWGRMSQAARADALARGARERLVGEYEAFYRRVLG
jgi:N-acetyl-alpha-D-glucosaminyl L-malate synthase BshA